MRSSEIDLLRLELSRRQKQKETDQLSYNDTIAQYSNQKKQIYCTLDDIHSQHTKTLLEYNHLTSYHQLISLQIQTMQKNAIALASDIDYRQNAHTQVTSQYELYSIQQSSKARRVN